MKLKIPPLFVVLIVVIVMWAMTYLPYKYSSFNFSGQNLIAIFLFVLGAVLLLLSVYDFNKHKTTVDPTKPDKASDLVMDGIYSVSRNPMYLGMFFLLTGWAVFLGNVINIFYLYVFIWYITKFQIKPEEKVLNTIFPKNYKQYCEKVRRWL